MRTLAALTLALLLPLSAVAAVKPVPQPDLSSLSPADASALREARASFEKVVPHQTGEVLAESHGLLGVAYARAGLLDAGATALDNAIELAPAKARWAYLRALVANAQGQPAQARDLLERAFARNAAYLPIRVALAGARMEAGDLAGARTLLEPVTRPGATAPVPFAMLGDIALRERRWQDAIAAYGQALEIDPEASSLQARLAQAHAGAGNEKAAAEARAKAGDASPQLDDPIGARLLGAAGAPATAPPPAPGGSSGSAAAVAQANELLQKGDRAGARRALDAGLARSPRDPLLLEARGQLSLLEGDFKRAREDANAAVAAQPDAVYLQIFLGQVAEAAGDHAAAQAAYTSAIERDPRSPAARARLGALLMHSGRPGQAAEQFRAALQLAPGEGIYLVHLVAAQAADGRCREGYEEVRKALATDADSAFLQELSVRLASTCRPLDGAARRQALETAERLYERHSEIPPVNEAYALALAADGRWDDAVRSQEAAMFMLLRSGSQAELAGYREFLDAFRARQLPARPFADASPVYAKPGAVDSR